MLKRTVQFFVFLGLAVLFSWLSIKGFIADPEKMEKFKNSVIAVFNLKSLFFVFLSMVCGVVAHYFRALRNILLIEPLGYQVRKSTAFYSVMTCYLGNLAFPRLGEVLRCTFLQRYDKVPFQKSLGTVVVERVFDLLIFALLFILIIFLNKELLVDLRINENSDITLGESLYEKWSALWKMKYIILCILIGLVALFMVFRRLKATHQSNPNQSKIIIKIKNIVIELWQSLISIKNLKHPFLFILYTIFIWLFYYFGVYLCFFAFDFLYHLGFMPAFVVLILGSIAFMVAQGGIGAYPLIVAGVLSLYGVGYENGTAAGWVGWGAQTIMILIVGCTTFILASYLKIEDRSIK